MSWNFPEYQRFALNFWYSGKFQDIGPREPDNSKKLGGDASEKRARH